MIKLDLKNQRLLKEIEEDGFQSISSIAKKIQVSKEIAHYRLNKLIKIGFIIDFRLIVDYFLLGYKYYRLALNIHNLKYDSRKRIISELKNIKKFDFRIYLSTDWDLEINIWVKHSIDFYEFYSDLINKYGEFIIDKEIHIITKLYLLNHTYLHNNFKIITLGESKEYKNLDELDLKIIEELQKNPRSNIVDLSTKLNIPVTTLYYRIKLLRKSKILKAIVPNFKKSLLGYNTYRVEMTLQNPSQKNRLITFLCSKTEVIRIAELIGNRDIDFEVDFKTTEELDHFLEELRISVNIIRDFEVINLVTGD
ncbi:Lrp/AsnC family transcriptional regulator [Candidatus Woesearchaeota archaeon]|nr:Lrp/AsnC family transcriptional regulator [Candidatus Woesearchaeota archaeon]